MAEEWRELAEKRVKELELAAAGLAMQRPTDATAPELPYHINTLMRRAVEEFQAAFHLSLQGGVDSSLLELAYSLWRDTAADFTATLKQLPLKKDYFARCERVFPGGEAKADVADVIQRMEELASMQVQFGRSSSQVSLDYLNMLEILAECGVVNDEPTLRRLTLRAWGRTQTTAEALDEFQLELAGTMMLGEHERSEVAGWALFRSGKAFRSGFAVQALSDPGVQGAVYGLVYPGNFAAPSWCYLKVAKDVIVASQPIDTDCGTSITNAWSRSFIKGLCGFLHDHNILRARNVRLFEHYFDQRENVSDRSATLDAVGLSANGNVLWYFVAQGGDPVRKRFEEITGGPMPAFRSFGFIDQMIKQFRSDAEKRVNELKRRPLRSMGGHIDFHADFFRRPGPPRHGPERQR